MQILGELVLLAPQLTVRQWVAQSGLDPVHQQSGTSVLNTPVSAVVATVICATHSICRRYRLRVGTRT